jgi:hypothetical protein
MHIYYLLLLIWFPFVAPEPSCDLCVHTTQAGSVTKTLLSILTIPVQALSLGHALTTIPSLQCAPVVLSISASTPLLPSGAMLRDQEHLSSWEPHQPHPGVKS